MTTSVLRFINGAVRKIVVTITEATEKDNVSKCEEQAECNIRFTLKTLRRGSVHLVAVCSTRMLQIAIERIVLFHHILQRKSVETVASLTMTWAEKLILKQSKYARACKQDSCDGSHSQGVDGDCHRIDVNLRE